MEEVVTDGSTSSQRLGYRKQVTDQRKPHSPVCWRIFDTPMAVPDPSADRAVAPAPDRARRLPWTDVVFLLFLAGYLVHSAHRVIDDRGRAAFVGLIHLNLLLHFYARRRFELAPFGSVARGRARLAVWLLSSTLMAGCTWKASTVVSRGSAIMFWLVDAAAQLANFHWMFVRGDM